MGVRPACLIENINIFYLIPSEANLEIHYNKYPGLNDYPLVTLKNSWVSKNIAKSTDKFTDQEIGLYLGFNCFDQDWANPKINRYEIKYSLNNMSFCTEVCSIKPDNSTYSRIVFKAKVMSLALKLINNKFNITYEINFINAY